MERSWWTVIRKMAVVNGPRMLVFAAKPSFYTCRRLNVLPGTIGGSDPQISTAVDSGPVALTWRMLYCHGSTVPNRWLVICSIQKETAS